MRGHYEELGAEVAGDEAQSVHRRPAAGRCEPETLGAGDPVGTDAEAVAHDAGELEVPAIGGVEHHRLAAYVAVGREVARQPPVQVRGRLVERRELLVRRQAVDDEGARAPMAEGPRYWEVGQQSAILLAVHVG